MCFYVCCLDLGRRIFRESDISFELLPEEFNFLPLLRKDNTAYVNIRARDPFDTHLNFKTNFIFCSETGGISLQASPQVQRGGGLEEAWKGASWDWFSVIMFPWRADINPPVSANSNYWAWAVPL